MARQKLALTPAASGDPSPARQARGKEMASRRRERRPSPAGGARGRRELGAAEDTDSAEGLRSSDIGPVGGADCGGGGADGGGGGGADSAADGDREVLRDPLAAHR